MQNTRNSLKQYVRDMALSVRKMQPRNPADSDYRSMALRGPGKHFGEIGEVYVFEGETVFIAKTRGTVASIGMNCARRVSGSIVTDKGLSKEDRRLRIGAIRGCRNLAR